MIYTVTFNPALDYAVDVRELQLGTVNRTKSESIFYGGKGINVSIVLKNLGVESIALGFIAGFTGDEIERGVKAIGVTTDFIRLPQGMSRINVKVTSSVETEINGQGPIITKDALNTLFHQLDQLEDGDILVLAGSIPSSLSDTIYVQIMKSLQHKQIRIVVDATKDLLKNVLSYHPFLIKPNEYELGDLFGVTLKEEEDIISYAMRLQEMGARNVLVSRGKKGAILIDETKKVHRMEAFSGDVVYTVGAGDSMVAGFLAGYETKNEYEEALRMGVAAGCATAFSKGLATKEMVNTLLIEKG